MSASKKVLERKLVDFGGLTPRVAGEIVTNISKNYIIRLDPIEHAIDDEVIAPPTAEVPRSGQAIAPGATSNDSFNDEDQSTAHADYDTDSEGEEADKE